MSDESFESPWLEAVAAAFRKRRRAIRYRARSFEVSRDVEATDDDVRERLVVDLKTLEARPAVLRLVLWPDRWAWVCVSRTKPRAPGARFAFHADCGEIDPGDLCALFERSINAANDGSEAGIATQALLSVWAAQAPRIDERS